MVMNFLLFLFSFVLSTVTLCLYPCRLSVERVTKLSLVISKTRKSIQIEVHLCAKIRVYNDNFQKGHSRPKLQRFATPGRILANTDPNV